MIKKRGAYAPLLDYFLCGGRRAESRERRAESRGRRAKGGERRAESGGKL